jgi:hypothetical protein
MKNVGWHFFASSVLPLSSVTQDSSFLLSTYLFSHFQTAWHVLADYDACPIHTLSMTHAATAKDGS